MERRNFLIGLGSTAAGASALVGSGAFSRVESQRSVTIQIAEDANAYLGMEPLDTPNSNNYVSTDGNGHLQIDIGEHDDFDGTEGGAQPGEGVNSDSFTFFDGMFQLCNQGKAEATISYALPEEPSHPSLNGTWTAPQDGYPQQVVAFYYIADAEDDAEEGTRVIVNEDQDVPLPLGECVEIGIRTVTKGVDATEDAPLIDGDITITADAPDAGEPTS